MSTQLAKFFEKGIKRTVSEGEVVLRGEEASGVFYIAKGYLKIYSISDDGNEYVHIIYKPGEIFPMIWALKGIRRRVFYEAISEAIIYEVPKDVFTDFLKSDARISYHVLSQLAGQFYIYADRLDNLQYRSAYERVVYRLLFLAGRFGVKKGNELIIDAPLTHELVAQSIGLARESVSRQIEKLEKDDLVEHRQGRIIIKDLDRLSREFSEPVSLNLWGLASKPSR